MNSVSLRLRSTPEAPGIEYNSPFKGKVQQSVISNDVRPRLGEILEQIKTLSAQERAYLIEELQENSKMVEIFDNGPTLAEILIRIPMLEKPELSRILRAIADRLASEN